MIGLSNGFKCAWLLVGKAKARLKNFLPEEPCRNQAILRFDVILQHNWPIEQCLLHIRVVCGGKTKSPCFDLFIHWLIKQITNTYRNHFSRSYENRSIWLLDRKVICTFEKRFPDWTYVMSSPKIAIIFVAKPFIRIFFLISGLRPSFSIVKRPSN